jgi:Phycobilisome protein
MFETLEQLFEQFISQINNLMGNPTLEDIEKIRKKLKETVLFDVAKLRKGYGKLIKAYYNKHKPFNHQTQNVEDKFQKDLEDFIELVSFATEADDPSILDDWAINYPWENKQVLAKDLSVYVDTLQKTMTDWDGVMADLQANKKPKWPDETKPYWAYLVNKLSSKI